ncbi:AAA family ATPase [Vibrio parahaemolyticus]|nr:AAA family ATPase [Vibrio parahaemolyticus]
MNKNKIKKITLDSFRAFSDEKELDFEIDNKVADIVVVYAPNGTGKTSTIEGIEWAATGKVSRLDTIISNNNAKNRNPKEGNILKNRYSGKKIGSVKLELESGKLIHRETKPKSRRNHDYCPGISKGSIKDVENFNNNILSQGTISKFSYEASSGSLFQSLIGNKGNSEDIEVYDKINSIKSSIDKSNSERRTEISYIKSLISNESKDVSLLEGSITEGAEFYSSEDYTLFKKNFMFFQDISEKSISDSISYLTEIKTSFENLKSKLIGFDLDEYKERSRDHLNASKVMKLESELIEKNADFERIEKQSISIKSKKDELDTLLSPKNIENINNKIREFNEVSFSIESCNDYIKKISNVNGLIQEKIKSINLLDLIDKDKKLSTSEGLINALFGKVDNEEITLLSENLFISKINEKITSKSSLLSSITKKSFIDENHELKHVLELNKKTHDLEQLNIKIKDLNSEKEKVISFEEKLGIIKSYVIEVINERTLSTCPACGTGYDDTNKLIESVNSLKTDSRQLIDGAIETLNKQKLELVGEIKTLNDTIDNLISELKQGINKEIEQLRERKQQALSLYACLSDLSIKYTQVNIIGLLKEISSIKKNVESRLSLLSRRKDKYENWSGRMTFRLSEKSKEQLTYEGNLKRLKDTTKVQFDLNINELILKSKSYHICLFERNKLTVFDKKLKSDLQIIENQLAELKEKISYLKVDAGFSKDMIMRDVIEIAQKNKRIIRADYNYIKSQITSYKTSNNFFFVDLINRIEQKCSAFLANLLTSQKIASKKESIIENRKLLEVKNRELREGKSKLKKIDLALDEAMSYFSDLASDSINSEVLNDMFMYVEPHLKYDEISFRVDLNGNNKGIYIQARSNSMDDNNTPIYYLSEAQINILSICIFLADHARETESAINAIVIDDPVQSMDDLNSYALIDLCKIFSRRFKKQIIITTHNRSFFNLFRNKLPEDRYSTKFISL